MQFLIIVLPFIMTGFIVGFEWAFPPAKFLLSRRLMVVWPVVTLAAMITLIWQPAATSNTGSFEFSALAKLFLTLLFSFNGVALLAAYATAGLNTGRFSPVTLGVSGAVQAALYITNPFLAALCFAAASFFAIVAVVDLTGASEERFVKAVRSAVRYLIASVLFGLLLFIALVFLERLRLDPQLTGLIKVVVALLTVSFALRLGVFPFNLWLPEMLEEGPGLSGFLVVGLINVAATVFLVDFLQKYPALLFDNYEEARLVMLLGLVGAVLAAVLALAQNGFGKMLAYTVSSDYGLILFALASPHNTGKNGAVFEAANLALMQLLIFTSLAVVYYCSRGSKLDGLSGLGRRMPVAAAGLMVGFLGMSGVPLLSGFAAKYMILQAAAQEGLGLALAAGAAIALCMIAYLRYFHRLFMGQDTPGLKTLPEPPGATSLIVLMVITTVIVGVWPAPLINWINRALQGAF